MPKKQIQVQVEQLGNGVITLDRNEMSNSFTFMFSVGLDSLNEIEKEFINEAFIEKLKFSESHSATDLQFIKNTADSLQVLISEVTKLLKKKFDVSIDTTTSILRRHSSSQSGSPRPKSQRSPRQLI